MLLMHIPKFKTGMVSGEAKDGGYTKFTQYYWLALLFFYYLGQLFDLYGHLCILPGIFPHILLMYGVAVFGGFSRKEKNNKGKKKIK